MDWTQHKLLCEGFSTDVRVLVQAVGVWCNVLCRVCVGMKGPLSRGRRRPACCYSAALVG
jgi:hypothetical protein